MRPAFPTTLAALLITAVLAASAVAAPVTRNLTLRANLDEYNTGSSNAYSACWSYVHGDGREYAILGVATGTAIYNITNPAATYRVGFIAGPPSVWREMKSYRQWLYIVTEGVGGGQGLQIVRMANPEAPVLAATYTTNFIRSHTVAVDTARALLVCNGTRDGSGAATGMRILSLANPEAPVEIGKWPSTYPASVPEYIHDSVPIGNRLYGSSVYIGTQRIFDFTDPANPTLTSSYAYPGGYYTHNAWPDASGNTLYVTDEQNTQRLRVIDITNPVSPTVVNAITANPKSIVHNAHVKDGDLWVSNYTEGIRAMDISDPHHPAEWAYADSYHGPSGGYSGVWEVCPYFPSGTVIASDMGTGLYVYTPVRDYGVIRARVIDGATDQPMPHVEVFLTSQGDSLEASEAGIVQFAPNPGSHTVTARKFGYYDAVATVDVVAGERDTIDLVLNAKPSIAWNGTIRNAATDAPLADASVTMAWTDLHEHTNAAGAYTFGAVPDDDYRVTIGRAGFAPITLTRRIGPGFPDGDYALWPAARWDSLELASGWTVGGAGTGDNATGGQWTRVIPTGTGPRPVSSAPQALCACDPASCECGELCPGHAHDGSTAVTLSSCTVSAAVAAPMGLVGPGKPAPVPMHEGHADVLDFNAAPYFDHTPGTGQYAFVTGNGTDTLNVDQADVDGGRTTLTSPNFDLSAMSQPRLSYWHWFFSRNAGTGQPEDSDHLIVLISNNGGASWTVVDTTRGWHNHWEEHVVDVAQHVTPTSQVRLRFVAGDFGLPSTVEAAIDDVTAWDAAQAPASVPDGSVAMRFGAPRPNPSRSTVALSLELPASGTVDVELLDVEGRRVRILHHGVAAAGRLALKWDGADESGTPQPAGLYFVRARAAGAEARVRVVRIP